MNLARDGTQRGNFEKMTDDRSFEKWLPDMDLNHDKQIQSLLCYRYTIGQDGTQKIERFFE